MPRVTRATAAGCLLVACIWSEDGKSGMDYDSFRVSRLHCVIGNNKAAGDHRAGYNGVFRMMVPGQDVSVFLPTVAGLNLEHYFDARPRNPEPNVFFEPRHVPMEFRRL